ncbi:MAG: hypothetical protein V2A79_14970 [Planctomycetota bacterium]
MIPRARIFRPQRNSLSGHPIIQQAAETLSEVARNMAGVYDGWLADERALTGNAGVYSVKVVSPLVLTDDGIALDMTDPQFRYQSQQSLLSGATPEEIAITAGGATPGTGNTASRSDHVHAHYTPSLSQAYQFGAVTGVTAVQPSGAYLDARLVNETRDVNDHGALATQGDGYIRVKNLPTGTTSTPPTGYAHDLLSNWHPDTLPSAVSRGSLIVGNSTPKWRELDKGSDNQILRMNGNDPNWEDMPSAPPGPGILATVKIMLHYKGTDDIGWTLVDSNNWTNRLIQWWSRVAATPADINGAMNVGSAGECNPVEGSKSLATPIVALIGPSLTAFSLALDETDGFKLKYMVNNSSGLSEEAAFFVHLDVIATVSETSADYTDVGNGA